MEIKEYGEYLTELVVQLQKQEKQYLDSYEEAVKRTYKAEVMLAKFSGLQNTIKNENKTVSN